MTLKDYAAVSAVILLWAFNFVAGKIGLSQFPPLFLVTMRLGFTALLLLPLLRRHGKPWALILGLSVILGGAHFGLMFSGLSGIDAAVTAIAVQLGVPFSAILAALLEKDRLNGWQIVGMAVAFGGVGILAGEPRTATSLPHLAMVVAASFTWALGNVLIRRIGSISPFLLNAWVAILAAPQVALLTATLEAGQLEALQAADWRGWGAVAYMVLGASIGAYGLWYYLLGRHLMSRIVPLTLLAPVFGACFSILILDEPLTTRLVLGGAVTICGVGLIHLAASRDPSGDEAARSAG